MPRRAALLACIGAALLAGCPDSPPPAPKTDSDRIQRLEAGEILVRAEPVEGVDVPRLHAEGLIDAPPAEVWEVVSRCADFVGTMPRVVEAEELERQGDQVTCRAKVDLPFPLPSLEATTIATHTVQTGKRYRRDWRLKEGSYTRNEGHWELEPYGEGGTRTLARYELLVVPNVPIPAALREAAQQKAIPEIYAGVRKRLAAP
jgi:carbon monoxide dehydrogenase subunit G